MITVLRVGAVVWCVGLAAPVMAQTAAPSPRVLLDVGGMGIGGGALGSTDATYITPTGESFTLFSTSQSWSAGAGIIGHLQVRVAPRVALEGHVSWTRPEIRARISSDFEGAADTTARSRVSQVVGGVGVVVSLTSRGTWTPFARGAVGWLRHLSNDDTLYQDGLSADLGGGLQYMWREKSGHAKPYGLRADAWVNVRRGGLELAQKSRVVAPGFSAAFIFKL